jgi:RNA polymerase sigma-70 factor (ECF subfamily)
VRSDFERRVLTHLPRAYDLARWLLRHPQDAEDAVQDAVVRAFRAYHSFAGGNAQAWLLAIVRNTCLTALQRRRGEGKVLVLADAMAETEFPRDTVPDPGPLPDARVITEEETRRLRAAIAALPVQFREVIVLRELHDLSYREIAAVVAAPVGTVMSRLARARERLAATLREPASRSGAEGKS